MTAIRLHVNDARENDRFIELAVGTEIIVLGRGPDAHVSLDDPFVSLRHAALISTKGGMMILDLGSLNGTRVNGIPLTPDQAAPLRPGDVIGVGRSEVVFGGD